MALHPDIAGGLQPLAIPVDPGTYLEITPDLKLHHIQDGSDMTVQLLAVRGQASLEQTVAWLRGEEDPRFAETLSRLRLVPPTEVFDIHEGLNLEFEGEAVQVYYPGPAHAPDNGERLDPGLVAHTLALLAGRQE